MRASFRVRLHLCREIFCGLSTPIPIAGMARKTYGTHNLLPQDRRIKNAAVHSFGKRQICTFPRLRYAAPKLGAIED